MFPIKIISGNSINMHNGSFNFLKVHSNSREDKTTLNLSLKLWLVEDISSVFVSGFVDIVVGGFLLYYVLLLSYFINIHLLNQLLVIIVIVVVDVLRCCHLKLISYPFFVWVLRYTIMTDQKVWSIQKYVLIFSGSRTQEGIEMHNRENLSKMNKRHF